MKRIGLLMLLPLVLVLSCGSDPEPVDSPPAEAASKVEPAEPPLQSTPPPASPPPVLPPPLPAPAPQPGGDPAVTVWQEERHFDPGSISREKLVATMADVQALIRELNGIIRARNYNAWTGFLSESYIREISSPVFLEERTEELYRRDLIVASNLRKDPRQVQKRILKTPKDYFDNVVVPSRQNDRVDAIDFSSENRVTAYTVDTRGNRLVLYNLELINNRWKIIH